MHVAVVIKETTTHVLYTLSRFYEDLVFFLKYYEFCILLYCSKQEGLSIFSCHKLNDKQNSINEL